MFSLQVLHQERKKALSKKLTFTARTCPCCNIHYNSVSYWFQNGHHYFMWHKISNIIFIFQILVYSDFTRTHPDQCIVVRFHLVQMVLERAARRIQTGLPSSIISSLTLLRFIRSVLCVSHCLSSSLRFCFLLFHTIIMLFSLLNTAAATQIG